MEEHGLFKPRHPVTGEKRQRVEWINPGLFAPVIADEPRDVSDDQKFQHIDCGAIHVTEDILEWQKNCTHCQSESIVSQFQVMELVESPTSVCDNQRYSWLKKAIKGFSRNGKQQSATLALRQMLSRKEFHRLINNREYGKDISLIEFAILHGDGNALLVLINAGATVNTSSFLMRSPLHFAVQAKKPWAIEILLEHGADPSSFHFYQESPLLLCSRLIQNQTDPQQQRLHVASARVLKFTRPVFGSQLDQKEKQHGNQGENHLHFAVRTLNEHYVLQLLQEGVNANLPNNGGFTPLMYVFSDLCFEDGTLSEVFLRWTVYEQFPELRGDNFEQNINCLLDDWCRKGLIAFREKNLYRIERERVRNCERLDPWVVNVLSMTRHKFIARLLFKCTDLTLMDNSHKTVFYHAVNSHSGQLCLELFQLGLQKDPNFIEYCCNVMIQMFLDPRTKEPTVAFQSIQRFLACCQRISPAENNWSVLHFAVKALPETDAACQYLSWLVYCTAPYALSKERFVVCENDIDSVDVNNESPLFLAVRLNKFKFVQQLAKDGASFTLQNHYGEFLFEVAEAVQVQNEAVINFVRQNSFEAIEEGPSDEIEEELQSRLSVMGMTEEQERLIKRYKQDYSMENSSGEESMSMSEDEQSESESPRFRR